MMVVKTNKQKTYDYGAYYSRGMTIVSVRSYSLKLVSAGGKKRENVGTCMMRTLLFFIITWDTPIRRCATVWVH